MAHFRSPWAQEKVFFAKKVFLINDQVAGPSSRFELFQSKNYFESKNLFQSARAINFAYLEKKIKTLFRPGGNDDDDYNNGDDDGIH